MTPSPWGRSPPAPGCIDTPEYRWILAASHPLRQPRRSGAAPQSPAMLRGGCPSKNQRSQCANLGTTRAERSCGTWPSIPRGQQGGGAGTGSGGAALHNARQDGGAGPGHGQRRSRSAAALARSLALPDANVPLWRRSARPWLLFGSVGTCGRASLSSSHTGCGAETAGVKILGL